ncbi:MAG: GNAT family N-acetyltransferase [Comamonas sp.]
MFLPRFASNRLPSLVPIRELAPRHRDRILAHLLKLDASDRYLRFGYAANDEQVKRYVEQLDFERDDIFGIFNRRLELVAMAHLAYVDLANHSNCAEFGVSVLKSARGKGLGGRLFERAALHARNHGVDMMFIHALSENTPMLKIARSAGAKVQRDGTESEAYLQLPPGDFDSRMAELVETHVAAVDYQFKKQAQQFWSLLADVQEIRKGVQEGRHQAGE